MPASSCRLTYPSMASRLSLAGHGKARSGRSGPRSGARSRRRTVLKAVAHLAGWTAVAALAAWGSLEAYSALRPLASVWFEIRTIAVEGASQIARDEVIEHMAIRPGETLWSLDVDQVVERLESHAWIKQATITRIPLHHVTVHITEREPVAVLEGESLSLLVDEEGHVLSVVRPVDELELPVLRGIDPNRLIHGEAVSRQTVRAGLEIARLIGQMFEGRFEVDARNPANLVASVGDLRFEFGASSFTEKWELYRKIRPALHVQAGAAEAGASEIDLRYPRKVIVRERG